MAISETSRQRTVSRSGTRKSVSRQHQCTPYLRLSLMWLTRGTLRFTSRMVHPHGLIFALTVSRAVLCALLNHCPHGDMLDLSTNDERFCSTWAEKKGKIKWARRWLAIAGCRLLCFRDEAVAPEGRKPPSTVPLNVIPMSASNSQSRFKTEVKVSGTVIHIKTFREYQFRFQTKDEANMWMQALSNASERQQHISEAEAGASKNRSHREQSKAAAVPSSSKSHNRGPTNMYGVPPPASIPGAPPGLPPPPKRSPSL